MPPKIRVKAKAKAKAKPRPPKAVITDPDESEPEPAQPQKRARAVAIARKRVQADHPIQSEQPDRPAKRVWECNGSCYMSIPIIGGTWDSRLALFDLDGTLLSTAGTDPVDEGIAMLRKYVDEGWTVGVISNQYGVSKGKTTHEKVRDRFDLLAELCPGPSLSLSPSPVIFMYAVGKDEYRKPMPGMYRLFMEQIGLDEHDADSFYCGDASGRAKDFAISDRYFAHNCGLDFLPASPFTALTPVAKKYDLYADAVIWKKVHLLTEEELELPDNVIVLMVGPPGAGKSTLTALLSTRYPDIVVLNRDTIGNTKKMDRMYRDAIRAGKSVILDNLNTNGDKRAEYLGGLGSDLDSEHVVLCYYFDIKKELSTHLCHMRVAQGGRYIPPVVRHTYYKHHQTPTETETGIDRVITLKGLPLLDGQEPPIEFNMCYNLKER